MYEISIKSGTNGWSNEDGCDMMIAKINSDNIPRVGETIQLFDKHGVVNEYLVTSIETSIMDYRNEQDPYYDEENSKVPVPYEFTTVYVLNTGYYGMEEYRKKYEILSKTIADLIKLGYLDDGVFRDFYEDARDEVVRDYEGDEE